MSPFLARMMRYAAPPAVIIGLVIMPVLVVSGVIPELEAPAIGWPFLIPAILAGLFFAVLAHREGQRVVDVYLRGGQVSLRFMDGEMLVLDPRRVTTVRRNYLINGTLLIRFDRDVRDADHVIFYPCQRMHFSWTHPVAEQLRDVLKLH